MPSLFDDLGGEPVLRKIIERFVDRVFDDIMIGFFFRNARRERIKQKEYEHAAEHLGAPVQYTGRAIDEAHRAHPIMGGQFLRRLTILRETLDEFRVPEHVKQHWLAHTEKLRPLVTSDVGTQCDPTAAKARVDAVPNAPTPRRKDS
jgi:hemoglobin